MALDHPDLVSALALLDTAARLGAAAQTAIRARADTTPREGMAATLDELFDRLPQIGAPTLVMVGEHDSSSPIPSAEELRANILHADLHIVDDAAHLSPIEAPDAVSGRLAAFLESPPSWCEATILRVAALQHSVYEGLQHLDQAHQQGWSTKDINNIEGGRWPPRR